MTEGFKSERARELVRKERRERIIWALVWSALAFGIGFLAGYVLGGF